MEIRALLSAMAQSKAGPLLVAAQVALAFAVVVNVAHVMEERLAASDRPTGMDLQRTFWVTTLPTSPAYNYAAAAQADLAYLNALPGVIAAAATASLPQTFLDIVVPVTTSPASPMTSRSSRASIYFGSAGLPQALGLTLAAGHGFDARSVQPPATNGNDGIPWAAECLVTRALAARLYPNGTALGKPVYVASTDKPAVITGIIDLMRTNPVPAEDDAVATQVLFLPAMPQGPDGAYVIRTAPARRDEIMARVAKEFAHLQPGRYVTRIESFEVTAARARQSYRATVRVLGAVAAVVLLVTLVGVAGLAAFHVRSRTRQLGVRRALGARRFHIVRYSLLESWITVMSGVALGCVLALAMNVELAGVYHVPRLPLGYLAGGALLMWLAATAAVMIPALRAAAVPPAEATRAS